MRKWRSVESTCIVEEPKVDECIPVYAVEREYGKKKTSDLE